MELRRIELNEDKNSPQYQSDDCKQLLSVYEVYYRKAGFSIPWVSYFVIDGANVVGSCGFVSAPINGRVEISYWTFSEYEGRGYAGYACNQLIALARLEDPQIIITAKTAPERNASVHILERKGFQFKEIVQDHEIGDAWLWVLMPEDKTQNAVNVFNKLANLYTDRFMNVSLYADTLDLFCSLLPQANAEIIELACGPGNVSRYILDKCPHVKLFGTDLAPNMIALARQHNPEAQFSILDVRDILSLKKQFDSVVCAFGLPYLSKDEAIQLIHDSASVLRESGVIYLSTMEDSYSKSGIQKGSSGDEIYMHYHEADYLISTLENEGFSNIKSFRKEYTDSKNNPVVDLILIATR